MTRPRRLLLIGAGGFAREALELVLAVNRVTDTWKVVGFLDDDPRLHGSVIHGTSVLGPAEAVHDDPDAFVVASVASPAEPMRRLTLVSRLGLSLDRYATLVHPAATVPESARIGAGSVLHASTVLTTDVEIGAHVAVMPGVILTHDDVVRDGVTFGAGVRVGGDVVIGQGAYVGAGALIRERVAVGAGALIGMGSVVTRSVPAREVWIGVPARRQLR